jgi:4'-phosphopantetheinyl transferase
MVMHNFSALSADAIVLLYLEAPEEASVACARVEAQLSFEKQARAARFRLQRDRNAFVAAHGLLRFALRQATGRTDWLFDAGPNGKPILVAGDGAVVPQFNITHTPGLAACGLALGGPIGVDAELRGRAVDIAGVGERCFTPDERRRVEAAGPERGRRFIEYWTLKEAVAKALGHGLAMDLRTFSVTTDPCAVRFEDQPDPKADPSWRLELTTLPRHCLAVAFKPEKVTAAPLEWREVSWDELDD